MTALLIRGSGRRAGLRGCLLTVACLVGASLVVDVPRAEAGCDEFETARRKHTALQDHFNKALLAFRTYDGQRTDWSPRRQSQWGQLQRDFVAVKVEAGELERWTDRRAHCLSAKVERTLRDTARKLSVRAAWGAEKSRCGRHTAGYNNSIRLINDANVTRREYEKQTVADGERFERTVDLREAIAKYAGGMLDHITSMKRCDGWTEERQKMAEQEVRSAKAELEQARLDLQAYRKRTRAEARRQQRKDATTTPPAPAAGASPASKSDQLIADEKACAGGAAAACERVAWNYRTGNGGVARDDAQAARFREQACEGGRPSACVSLGYQYEHGLGVSTDLPRAAELFERGCAGGAYVGCSNLAWYYMTGKGVPLDYARARKLAVKACDGGVPRGCWEVGVVDSEGDDRRKAAPWFERACNDDFARACLDLGDMYAHHGSDNAWRPGDTVRGLDKDVERARRLYDRACSLGTKNGCTRRDALAANVYSRDGFSVQLPPGWTKEVGEQGLESFMAPDQDKDDYRDSINFVTTEPVEMTTAIVDELKGPLEGTYAETFESYETVKYARVEVGAYDGVQLIGTFRLDGADLVVSQWVLMGKERGVVITCSFAARRAAAQLQVCEKVATSLQL
jgi:TPR repeat protein